MKIGRIRLLPLSLGLFLALFWGLLSWAGALARPEWFFYHALFELRGPLPRPADVVVIAIDEVAMEELKVWPPPRSLYAELVDGLMGAGASAIGIDVAFPQAQTPESDGALAGALKRHPNQVVLAANFQPFAQGGGRGEQLVLPLADFRSYARVGIVNLPYDADGAIHRFYPAHSSDLFGGRSFDSFDLALLKAARGNHVAFPDPEEATLINYAGPPGYFKSVSLVQTLDALRTRDPHILSQFRGAVVLVGATSLRMQDLYPTPYSAGALRQMSGTYMPGVEIHANILNTLLREAPIQRVPFLPTAALLLSVALAGSALFASLTPAWGVAALLALVAALWGAIAALFIARGLWIDAAAPTFLAVSVHVASVGEHFLRSEATKRQYRKTFERYVSPDIVNEILRNPDLAPKLGGERREVSVLFSDIRSFTTISEQRSPEEVVEFLNAYLTAMADVILEQGGCIDKYIGDAILAVWGNVQPMPPEEAARKAVRAALAMRAKVEAMRPVWEAQGYPRIDIGVGINTGEAVVGNIGSPRKLEFGVIGDSINVASRLEGLTKQYGGALLVSERTWELLGDAFVGRYLDTAKVKGREAPVAIYAVEQERGAP